MSSPIEKLADGAGTGTIVLLWGVAFGTVALICAALVVRGSSGEGWTELPVAAGVAAFVLGMVLRRFLAAPTTAPSRWRGAAIGVLITFVSHPAAWWFAILYHALWGTPFSLGDAPEGLLEAFSGGLLLGLWSLLLTGWWTLPVGFALGMLVALLEKRIRLPTKTGLSADSVHKRRHTINPMIIIFGLFSLALTLGLVGAYGYPPVNGMGAGFDWTTSLVIFILLLPVIWRFIEDLGSARMLLLFLSCVFLIPTALGLAVGGVLTLNGLLDRSESTHHVARVVGLRGVRSGTGPGKPYQLIQLESWKPGEADPWIQVHPLLSESVTPGESLVGVVTKPGWLGIEWIVDVHEEDD